MDSLLEYNPYFRPSAKELLSNKIFDEVRIKDNEIKSNGKCINIEMDKASSDYAFDYENEVHKKPEEELVKNLRARIVYQAQKFNK